MRTESYPWDDNPKLSIKRQQVLDAAGARDYPRVDLTKRGDAHKNEVGPGVWPWVLFVEQASVDLLAIAWKKLDDESEVRP